MRCTFDWPRIVEICAMSTEWIFSQVFGLLVHHHIDANLMRCGRVFELETIVAQWEMLQQIVDRMRPLHTPWTLQTIPHFSLLSKVIVNELIHEASDGFIAFDEWDWSIEDAAGRMTPCENATCSSTTTSSRSSEFQDGILLDGQMLRPLHMEFQNRKWLLFVWIASVVHEFQLPRWTFGRWNLLV